MEHYLLVQNMVTQQFDIKPMNENQANIIQEIDNYYKKSSYGALFSEENGILSGIMNPTLVRQAENITRNPLTSALKNACVNAYESDPYLQAMLDIINLYTLDGDITAELQPINAQKFKDKESLNKELYKYVKKDDAEQFNDDINILDDHINLWHYVSIANIQRRVFGLAGIWKYLTTEDIKDKKMKLNIPKSAPIELVTLDPYYFDQAIIDKATHLITHYIYNDPNMHLIPPKKTYEIKEDKQIKVENVDYKLIRQRTAGDNSSRINELKLPVSQMIVFINKNNQITPNTYGYGSSDVLPILALSSNTRRINEKILPQINETQYLGVGILKIKSDSNVDMNQLKERINQSGGRFATNADIEYIEISNKFDMAGTLNQRQLNIRNMLMKFQIPSPIFNFEEITNKATIDTVVTFLIKVIGRERRYIERILWEQHYQPLLALYFNKQKYLNYRVKVRLNFPPIDFTSLLDKVAAWLAAYKVDVITKPEYRSFMDLEPFSAQGDTFNGQNNQTSFLQQSARETLKTKEIMNTRPRSSPDVATKSE